VLSFLFNNQVSTHVLFLRNLTIEYLTFLLARTFAHSILYPRAFSINKNISAGRYSLLLFLCYSNKFKIHFAENHNSSPSYCIYLVQILIIIWAIITCWPPLWIVSRSVSWTKSSTRISVSYSVLFWHRLCLGGCIAVVGI